MGITDIIRHDAEINVTLRAKDLDEYSRRLLAEARREFEREHERSRAEEDRLLTEEETLTYLSTSSSTLYRMQQRGELIPYYFAGAKRYKLSDIHKCLKIKN